MKVAADRTDVERTCDALDRRARGLAALLRTVAHPSRAAVGVWDIAETAVHVSQSATAFLSIARDGAAAEDLGRSPWANREAVQAEPERRLDVLAARTITGEDALVAYARGVVGDPVVMPFLGVSMPLSSMLAIELGELLVHGFDIARAAGVPWDIDPSEAAIALDGDLHVLPAMLDPRRSTGVRLSCDLRVRHGRRWLVTVEDGALALAPDGVGRDCHASVDPVAFLLLTFDRIGPLRPLLTGGIVVWGPRPWAFARLQRVLTRV